MKELEVSQPMIDYVYAHMWWNIAAPQGDKVSSEQKDIIEEKMTPSQIEKAQDLACECVKKNYKGCCEIGPLYHPM